MAWDISISAEGWREIYDELERWDREELVAALACDDTEEFNKNMHPSIEQLAQYEGYRATHYKELAHDTLVDLAFERVERHNTCDNGGNGYYIDRDGYHKVSPKEKP